MSIDDLARTAAADARRKASQEVAPSDMLARLHRSRRMRTLVSVAAVLVVGVLALVGGGTVVAHNRAQSPVGGPATTPSGSAPESPCAAPGVTCLGGGRFRVALTVPVTVTLPVNFAAAFTMFGPGVVEDYRNDVDATGVTVMENAVPVKDDATWTRDPAAGSTAESVATWLSLRPFLVHATLSRTTVGGRPAWHVSAGLTPGAALRATKGGMGAVAPTFSSDDATAAYGPSLIGDYTLLDVPGAGVTVIWTWSMTSVPDALSGSRAYTQGMSFG